MEVRDDARVVGEDPHALADREGLARLDRDDAVLLGEAGEAALAPEDRAVAGALGAQRIVRKGLGAGVDDGAVRRRGS